MDNEWDYNSEYCDGCAELGMTTCSCEPDGEEACDGCGAETSFLNWNGLCDDCQDEEDAFLDPQDD